MPGLNEKLKALSEPIYVGLSVPQPMPAYEIDMSHDDSGSDYVPEMGAVDSPSVPSVAFEQYDVPAESTTGFESPQPVVTPSTEIGDIQEAVSVKADIPEADTSSESSQALPEYEDVHSEPIDIGPGKYDEDMPPDLGSQGIYSDPVREFESRLPGEQNVAMPGIQAEEDGQLNFPGADLQPELPVTLTPRPEPNPATPDAPESSSFVDTDTDIPVSQTATEDVEQPKQESYQAEESADIPDSMPEYDHPFHAMSSQAQGIPPLEFGDLDEALDVSADLPGDSVSHQRFSNRSHQSQAPESSFSRVESGVEQLVSSLVQSLGTISTHIENANTRIEQIEELLNRSLP